MSSSEARAQVPIEQVLPHRAPILVIEEVLSASPSGCRSRLQLRQDGPYFEADGFVPFWAVEVMAQGLGAGLGVAAGARPAQGGYGYVVGIEDFSMPGVGALVPGAEVTVAARVEAEIPPVLECAVELLALGRPVASARLRLLMGVAPLVAATAGTDRPGGPLRTVVEPDGRWVATGVLPESHRYFQGHFPGAPVLPAVGHLDLVEWAAAEATGGRRRIRTIERARFQRR
jgi:3-hydroxymyristoyl/3-hydroxydecanoyl-(acyl carrier protein) dehydratase